MKLIQRLGDWVIGGLRIEPLSLLRSFAPLPLRVKPFVTTGRDKRYHQFSLANSVTRLPSSNGNLSLSVPLCLCVIFLLLLGVTVTTYAHADLASASPDIGETLTESPEKIILTFNELLQNPSSIIVFSEGFNQVELPDAVLSATILSVELPELEDGTYTVQWDVVSADNDPITGTYQFAIQPQPTIPELSGGTAALFGIASLIALLFIVYRGRTLFEDQI